MAGYTNEKLFLADDSDLCGTHREVQDAAGWGNQPDGEQSARAEVGDLMKTGLLIGRGEWRMARQECL